MSQIGLDPWWFGAAGRGGVCKRGGRGARKVSQRGIAAACLLVKKRGGGGWARQREKGGLDPFKALAVGLRGFRWVEEGSINRK